MFSVRTSTYRSVGEPGMGHVLGRKKTWGMGHPVGQWSLSSCSAFSVHLNTGQAWHPGQQDLLPKKSKFVANELSVHSKVWWDLSSVTWELCDLSRWAVSSPRASFLLYKSGEREWVKCNSDVSETVGTLPDARYAGRALSSAQFFLFVHLLLFLPLQCSLPSPDLHKVTSWFMNMKGGKGASEF